MHAAERPAPLPLGREREGDARKSDRAHETLSFCTSGRMVFCSASTVPETFVVDKAGVIRYKHIGPVTVEALQNTILPLVQKLKRA